MSTSFANQLIWISNVILSCIDFVEDLFEGDGDEKTHGSDTPDVPQLPDLAIVEILLKLPINSIVQCRHVCKLWNQLISDPYFTRVYLKNSPPTIFSITHHTFTKPHEPPVDVPANYVEMEKNGEIKPTPLNLNPVGTAQSNKSWKKIVGSYDGLLCLVETPRDEDNNDLTCMFTLKYPNRQAVWILNPLIGEHIALPKVKAAREFAQVAYGFGSTADGKHYKVVRFAMKYTGCVVEGQILTIGVDDKWRDVEISEVPLFLYSNGVALNGVLHFVGSYDRSFESLGVIYAFDFMKETGQCFALPCPVRRRYFKCEFFLAIWDGHLCLTDNSHKLQVAIWTMKRYGVVESWNRDIILKNLISSYKVIPIATMRNGDLLISHYSRLFSFSAETKNCVEFKIFNPEGINSFVSGYAYTPSFVSPQDISSRHASTRG